MSTRQAILELVKARLQAIPDASVYLGVAPELGQDDPDQAFAIIPGDDQVDLTGKSIAVALPIEIQILAKANLDAPWVAVEEGLAAVKVAMEIDDTLFGGGAKLAITRGVTRTLEHQPGQLAVGASITYPFSYGEAWGQP